MLVDGGMGQNAGAGKVDVKVQTPVSNVHLIMMATWQRRKRLDT